MEKPQQGEIVLTEIAESNIIGQMISQTAIELEGVDFWPSEIACQIKKFLSWNRRVFEI